MASQGLPSQQVEPELILPLREAVRRQRRQSISTTIASGMQMTDCLQPVGCSRSFATPLARGESEFLAVR